MILQELFKQYIEMIRPLQSLQTVRTKEGFINKHVFPKLGLKEVDGVVCFREVHEVDFLMLQNFVNDLLKNDLKPKTVKNILDVIKVVFKLAIRMNLVKENPCDYVELPKYDNKRYFSFSTSVQTDFIHALLTYDVYMYRDIFLFLLPVS